MIEAFTAADGRVLAQVLRLGSPLADGVHFFSAPEDLLQVGASSVPAGHVFPMHVHLPEGRVTVGTAEVLVVLAGMIKVDLFEMPEGEADPDPSLRCKRFRLGPKDVAVFAPGVVHRVTATIPSVLVEIKNGPYRGPEADKVKEGDDAQEETSKHLEPPRAAEPQPEGLGGW